MTSRRADKSAGARGWPAALGCAGLVCVVVGTFLPWLYSGSRSRNSLNAMVESQSALFFAVISTKIGERPGTSTTTASPVTRGVAAMPLSATIGMPICTWMTPDPV